MLSSLSHETAAAVLYFLFVEKTTFFMKRFLIAIEHVILEGILYSEAVFPSGYPRSAVISLLYSTPSCAFKNLFCGSTSICSRPDSPSSGTYFIFPVLSAAFTGLILFGSTSFLTTASVLSSPIICTQK